jgi:hypothetical protein
MGMRPVTTNKTLEPPSIASDKVNTPALKNTASATGM